MTDAHSPDPAPAPAESAYERLERLVFEFGLDVLVQQTLLDDMLGAFAGADPAAVGLLRDNAMKTFHQVESGRATADTPFPSVSFWRERSSSLERAMRAVGLPYQSATVTAFPTRKRSAG